MTNPTFTVFYSWQSDRPNALNRGFIQDALEKATKAIKRDDSIEVDCVLDRDTQGRPGSPDISVTIFEKIDRSVAARVRFVRGWRNARCAGLQIAPWWAKSGTRRFVKGRFGIHTGLRSLCAAPSSSLDDSAHGPTR